MILFSNKDLAFVEIDGRNIEIAFCDANGIITELLNEKTAYKLHTQANNDGISATLYHDDSGRKRVLIPWTFTNVSRNMTLYTGATNAKTAILYA